MLIDLDQSDIDIIVNNIQLYKFPKFRDKFFKVMQGAGMISNPRALYSDTDPVTQLNKKLASMPMPDNPLDITDEQLQKMSKIISMGLMKNMAMNTVMATPPPAPKQDDLAIRENKAVHEKLRNMETAIRNLCERMDKIQYGPPEEKRKRTRKLL